MVHVDFAGALAPTLFVTTINPPLPKLRSCDTLKFLVLRVIPIAIGTMRLFQLNGDSSLQRVLPIAIGTMRLQNQRNYKFIFY